jgi:Ca-activated chloride channel family protein
MRFAGLVLGGVLVLQPPIERRPPQQSQEVPTIRVETRLVNVALNVVDAKGSPVGGLNKDDFEVFEDGKPQKIAIFEKESSTPVDCAGD